MTKQLTPFGALGAIRRTINLIMALVIEAARPLD